MSARCMAVMANLETEETMVVGTFIDEGEGMDPAFHCEALWKSVEADWPGWTMQLFMNDEAAELMAQRRMWSFGMLDADEPMYGRIEAHNEKVRS